MKTSSASYSAVVMIAFAAVLAETAVARTIQLPSEPIAPTSYEQCNDLSTAYLSITSSLGLQISSCNRVAKIGPPVGSGCTWTIYQSCLPLHELRCETESRRDRAMATCRQKVSEHKRRTNEVSQRARQQEREQNSGWASRSGITTKSPDQRTRMARSSWSSAKTAYLNQLKGAVQQTSAGSYMRALGSVQSAQSAASKSVDILGNVKHAGALNAARTWFDGQANIDNLLASVTGRSVGSVQNPVVRMIMAASLGVLLDHQREMLGLSEELGRQMSNVSAGQTFAWQSNYRLHSAPIIGNGHDPAQELLRALEQVVASIAKEHQVRAAENRQAVANAVEARRVEEARRQRAEMARAAEAARQSQARAAKAVARQQERSRAAAREADRWARDQEAREQEDYEHQRRMNELYQNTIQNFSRQYLRQQQQIQQLRHQQQIQQLRQRQQIQQRTPSYRLRDCPAGQQCSVN